MRGLLPELPKKLNVEEAEKARDRVQEKYTADRQTRSTSRPLQMGQKVWMQDQQSKKWDIEGVIKSIRNGGRSFVVETSSGAAYLRNRRFIKAAARMTAVVLRASTTPTKVEKTTKKKVTFQRKVTFKLAET